MKTISLKCVYSAIAICTIPRILKAVLELVGAMVQPRRTEKRYFKTFRLQKFKMLYRNGLMKVKKGFSKVSIISEPVISEKLAVMKLKRLSVILAIKSLANKKILPLKPLN